MVYETIPSKKLIILNNINFIPGLDLIEFLSQTHDAVTQKQWEEMPSTVVTF